jgi:tRNA nucleotidyltransferase (CCA-adding enzyme)
VELAETQADGLGRAWLVYLAALLHGLKVEVIRRICERLTLAPRTTQELIDGLTAVERACDHLCQEGDMRPSEVVAALRNVSLEMLPLLLARCPDTTVKAHVQRYVTIWRHVRPDVSGDDLRRLGVPQGPAIGRLLTRALAAKLDGEAPSREAQEALVRSLMHQGLTPHASDQPLPEAKTGERD